MILNPNLVTLQQYLSSANDTQIPSEKQGVAAVMIDWENIVGTGVNSLLRLLCELDKELVSAPIIRAYANWNKYESHTTALKQLGVEIIQMPVSIAGKNSADLRLAIDAVEIFYTRHRIDTLVIVSGDRDFVSLVRLAKRMGHTVWCYGLEDSTSKYLRDACDRWQLIPSKGKKKSQSPASSSAKPSDASLPIITPDFRQAIASTFLEAWSLNLALNPQAGQLRPSVNIDRFFSCLKRNRPSFRAEKFCGFVKRRFARSAMRLANAGLVEIDTSNPTRLKLSPGLPIQRLLETVSSK